MHLFQDTMTNHAVYYFDFVRDGHEEMRDEDGVALHDLAAARSEAMRAILEVAADNQWTTLAVMVRNNEGRLVHVATLNAAAYDMPLAA